MRNYRSETLERTETAAEYGRRIAQADAYADRTAADIRRREERREQEEREERIILGAIRRR